MTNPTNKSERSRKVLVVDDDPANLKLITHALNQEKFEVQTAESGTECIQKVDVWRPDLVLMDFHMPGLSGLDTLKVLRTKEIYVATIFVSANADTDDIVECLEAGADDYIRKPFRVNELITRVRVRFRIKDLNDELRRANDRLKELSETDDLTGLLNMRAIYPRIDRELRRAKRYDRRVACVMMDIDHFKEVNDQSDHLFGSFVIKEIGQLIRGNMREVDFAARYGGDEFLMVLTETNDAGARAFTERVRKTIEQHQFNDGKNQIRRTVSLGYAVSDPVQDLDARELVRRADHALFSAKAAGRNRVVSADDSELKKLRLVSNG